MIVDWPEPKTSITFKVFTGSLPFIVGSLKVLAQSCLSSWTARNKTISSEQTLQPSMDFKKRMTEASIMRLPAFTKLIKVECDALVIGIVGVLSQERRPITYFSEKLNEDKQKYSTYDIKSLCRSASLTTLATLFTNARVYPLY